MRITVATFGSRGDTQPLLALALGLQRAGHHPTMVVPQDLAGWVSAYGLAARPMKFSVQEFMHKPAVAHALKGRNLLRQLRMVRDAMDTLIAGVLDDTLQTARESDFLVLPITECGGADIAGELGIPMAYASLQPMYPPTRAFPCFFSPLRLPPSGGMNRMTYRLFMLAAWTVLGGPFNRWRARRFGLPPWRSMREMLDSRRSFGTPWLYAYSPQVLPKPADWEDVHHVTGYWFLDAPPDWRPPAELVDFLESGPPPVYIGFGSMTDKDPQRQARLALRALELAGTRGIVSTGWGGVSRLESSAEVLFVDDVPHSWLFPRTAAVVHHGGAGTTGAGLRAGVPSLITPFAGDQYAWADLTVKLGVGPRLEGAKHLTAEKLASAIDACRNGSGIRARAAALGEKIRAEDGAAGAVEIIGRHAEDFRRR